MYTSERDASLLEAEIDVRPPRLRPAHVHVLALKPGFKTLISQVYADDDRHLDSDPQFGVTRALVGRFAAHQERHPEQPALATPWYSLEHTFFLEPGEAVLPRPPIE